MYLYMSVHIVNIVKMCFLFDPAVSLISFFPPREKNKQSSSIINTNDLYLHVLLKKHFK